MSYLAFSVCVFFNIHTVHTQPMVTIANKTSDKPNITPRINNEVSLATTWFDNLSDKVVETVTVTVVEEECGDSITVCVSLEQREIVGPDKVGVFVAQ